MWHLLLFFMKQNERYVTALVRFIILLLEIKAGQKWLGQIYIKLGILFQLELVVNND